MFLPSLLVTLIGVVIKFAIWNIKYVPKWYFRNFLKTCVRSHVHYNVKYRNPFAVKSCMSFFDRSAKRLISLAIIVWPLITGESENKTLRANEVFADKNHRQCVIFLYSLRLPDENHPSLRVHVSSHRCPRVPHSPLLSPTFSTSLYMHTGNELYRYVLYVSFFPPWLWNGRPTEYINILVFVIHTESDYYGSEPVSTQSRVRYTVLFCTRLPLLLSIHTLVRSRLHSNFQLLSF